MVRMGEREVAGHLGADRLRIVVVEDQAVDVVGKIFDVAGDAGLGRDVFAAQGENIHAALVDEFHAGRARQVIGGLNGCGSSRGAHLLLHATVQQGIPAHDQMVNAWALVAEVAIGRPAAFAVVVGSGHHIHAAVDDPVHLFAHDEALD